MVGNRAAAPITLSNFSSKVRATLGGSSSSSSLANLNFSESPLRRMEARILSRQPFHSSVAQYTETHAGNAALNALANVGMLSASFSWNTVFLSPSPCAAASSRTEGTIMRKFSDNGAAKRQVRDAFRSNENESVPPGTRE